MRVWGGAAVTTGEQGEERDEQPNAACGKGVGRGSDGSNSGPPMQNQRTTDGPHLIGPGPVLLFVYLGLLNNSDYITDFIIFFSIFTSFDCITRTFFLQKTSDNILYSTYFKLLLILKLFQAELI